MAEDPTGTDPTIEEPSEPHVSFDSKEEYEAARGAWAAKAVKGKNATIAKLERELAEHKEAQEGATEGDDAMAKAQAKWDRQVKTLQGQIDEQSTKLAAHAQEKRDAAVIDHAVALCKAANVPPDWRDHAALALMSAAEFEVQEDGSVAVNDAAKGIALTGTKAEQWAELILKGSAFLQAKPSPSPAVGAGNPGRPGAAEKPFEELTAVERLDRIDKI